MADIIIKKSLKSARFLKLYSEFYDQPLKGSRTVNDLTKRIGEFLETNNVILPPCDVFPDEKSKFWIYKAKGYNPKELMLGMTLINTTNSEEEIIEIVSSELDESAVVCVVSTQTCEITYIEKTLH